MDRADTATRELQRQYTKDTFRIYWQHAMRFKWSLFLATAFFLIANLAQAAIPYSYKLLIDGLSIGTPFDGLLWFLGLAFLAHLVNHLSIRFGLYANSIFQTGVMRDLGITCFNYIHRHATTFFQDNFVGSLVKRVGRFYRRFERIADIFFFEIGQIVLSLVIMTTILTLRSPIFGAVIIIWVILYVGCNYLFSKYKLQFDETRTRLESKVTALLADTITNNVTVKLFNGYQREADSFQNIKTEHARMERFTWDIVNHFEFLQGFLTIALEIAMMYIALLLWQDGTITVGDFVLIQGYLINIFNRLWNVGRIFRDLSESIADANEMTEILMTPLAVTDAKTATDLVVTEGNITLENVTFSYNQTRTILKKLSLEIKPGEKVALVGHSGAGKSTVTKLLLRQYDVSGGKIMIDGQKLHRVTLESLWQHVGYVPQDPILFHRSLMDNIRYGRPDASDEEVIAAAKAAHAHEFIDSLQDGYETFVGERGVKLSGGERQRVAIARAILKDAPILLLDEATSSLDSHSEQLIQEALVNLMKDKTVVVIAHRLSTIMKMDRIIVMDKGEIIEQGTHKQLLRKKTGKYRQLWDIQAGEFVRDT